MKLKGSDQKQKNSTKNNMALLFTISCNGKRILQNSLCYFNPVQTQILETCLTAKLFIYIFDGIYK